MVQHIQHPGDGRDESTGLHTPESIRKDRKKAPDSSKSQKKLEAPESFVPKPTVEEPPHIKKLNRFIEFHELIKLKNYLQEQGGAVSAVSSETKKKIGRINTFKHVWDSKDLQAYIVECVRNNDYVGALEFVENNEQYIMEAWVDDYLSKKSYQEAATTLRDFAKIKPSKELDEEVVKLEEQIDEEILSSLDEEVMAKKLPEFNLAHDRVWSMVHNGCYAQAAELCDQLNAQEYRGETLEEAQRKRGKGTIPAPMKFEETPEEAEQRHEAELLRALPKTAEEMKTVFKDLPELITHYHHLAHIDEKDTTYIAALQGSFELFVDRLFEQKKVVIKEHGMVNAQEELLGLVDDLGYLGFHLYINHRSKENTLYLMAGHEADADYYTPVDLRNLFPKDIVLDEENFVEENPPTLRMDEEKTLTGQEPTEVREQTKFTWVSKIVTIKPEKAHELRRAA